MKCWECEIETEDIHHHHPVPRVRGGTKTIPLCESCHGKAHHRKGHMNTSALTKEGLRRAKERGVKLGNPNPRPASLKSAALRKKRADAFAARVMPVIEEIQSAGITTMSGIALALTRRGIKSARGGKWYATTVQNIIRRADK